MRTDHDVIGETHSLLTPLSVTVRLRGSSHTEVLPAQTTAGRSETETAWVACVRIRCGLDAPRPATAAARANFKRLFHTTVERGRSETVSVVAVTVISVSFSILRI